MPASGERAEAAGDRAAGFWAVARQIGLAGTRGAGRVAFLSEVSQELLRFSGTEAIAWWLTDVERDYRWRVCRGDAAPGEFTPVGSDAGAAAEAGTGPRDGGERISGGGAPHPPARGTGLPLAGRLAALLDRLGAAEWTSTARRSLGVRDAAGRRRIEAVASGDPLFDAVLGDRSDSPLLLLPLREGEALVGLIALEGAALARFESADFQMYEQLSETIWRAVVNRRAQFRLRERIKELTCLHGIARVSQRGDLNLEGRLGAIVALLPAAMQAPAIATATLRIGDQRFETRPGAAAVARLMRPIVAGGTERGMLEVAYVEPHGEFATGAFLREERDLLESVATEIGSLVERAEAATAQASLAEGLRRRDRLASIGQLAAGVAHELNEPLGNILGFAELMQKHAGLPDAARRDAQQIVQATLHGREIVRKLLQFARQGSEARGRLDLARLVRDSLYFLEARCRKGGIALCLEVGKPAWVVGSAAELTQVLVNLGVNAIQAMPQGGELTVGVRREPEAVLLEVRDNGVGMDAATQERLFTPFFTTKEIGAGTGLGLSVVMGIVTAHGGTIRVESAPGRGSRFVVLLPANEAEES